MSILEARVIAGKKSDLSPIWILSKSLFWVHYDQVSTVMSQPGKHGPNGLSPGSFLCFSQSRVNFNWFIWSVSINWDWAFFDLFSPRRPFYSLDSMMSHWWPKSGFPWTEINRFPWIKISSLGFFSVWDKKFLTNLFAPIRIVSAWPGPNLAAIDRESSIKIKRRKFDILKLGHLKS